MYYGNYDSNGKYMGFYTNEIHGANIPTPTIELSEKEWQEALTGNYKVVDGKHTYCEPTSPTNEEIKQQKLSELDSEYQPQFAELSKSLGMATLAENTHLITSIKTDYATLKAEYDAKRGGISG